MEAKQFSAAKFEDFRWMNEPREWSLKDSSLSLTTEKESNFWLKTYWDNFDCSSGHVYGIDIKDDFTFQICVEANLDFLYDQAGLMLYADESHWLTTSVELNEGEPVMNVVLTNGASDWSQSMGLFKGEPGKLWIRLTRAKDVVCIKYSTDNKVWHFLKLCPFPKADKYFVGPVSSSPKRAGLKVKFSDLSITKPAQDILAD